MYELKENDGKTHVSLRQDNNRTAEAAEHSQENWETMLSALKEVVEGRRNRHKREENKRVDWMQPFVPTDESDPISPHFDFGVVNARENRLVTQFYEPRLGTSVSGLRSPIRTHFSSGA